MKTKESETSFQATVSEAVAEYLDTNKELSGGGNWCGAYRRYLQDNVRRGDSVMWGSEERLEMSARQIEDMAKKVAIETLIDERKKQKREKEEAIRKLEYVYIKMLRLPHGKDRIFLQGALATCRDAIRHATGRDAQEVQEHYEYIAAFPERAKAEGFETFED